MRFLEVERAATVVLAAGLILVSGYGYGEIRAHQAREAEAERTGIVEEAQANYIRETNTRDACAARYTVTERLAGEPAVKACHEAERARAEAVRVRAGD